MPKTKVAKESKGLKPVVQVDEAQVCSHVDAVVRDTVEEEQRNCNA